MRLRYAIPTLAMRILPATAESQNISALGAADPRQARWRHLR
jgi:hypothetical protein